MTIQTTVQQWSIPVFCQEFTVVAIVARYKYIQYKQIESEFRKYSGNYELRSSRGSPGTLGREVALMRCIRSQVGGKITSAGRWEGLNTS